MSTPSYRLSTNLSPFQRDLYIHLIEWKRRHGMTAAGLYHTVRQRLHQHHQRFPFRFHKHFNHMASSQAACVNLFLPILMSSRADDVLRAVKPDLARVERGQLDDGFCIEFWGGTPGPIPAGNNHGPLKDKSKAVGTDCDMAIAYRNHEGKLCLWLIEHKLTEREFTTCRAYRSDGRKAARAQNAGCYDCDQSFSAILQDKSICYYHAKCGYDYWNLTDRFSSFFQNHSAFPHCPFRDGMNQLWRNQLLALAIEADPDQPYNEAYFSVVKHPRNLALDSTLSQYESLVGKCKRFRYFNSTSILDAAKQTQDTALLAWVDWYQDLYNV